MNIERATLERIRRAFEATNSRDHRRLPPKGNNYIDPMAQADWESFVKGWQASREDLGEPVAYRFKHDAEHDNGVCMNATGLVEFDDYVWRDKTGWRNITALYALPEGGTIQTDHVRQALVALADALGFAGESKDCAVTMANLAAARIRRLSGLTSHLKAMCDLWPENVDDDGSGRIGFKPSVIATVVAARAALGGSSTPVTWEFAQRIADAPSVHEALQMFSEDPTGDAGTSLIRTVLEEAKC